MNKSRPSNHDDWHSILMLSCMENLICMNINILCHPVTYNSSFYLKLKSSGISKKNRYSVENISNLTIIRFKKRKKGLCLFKWPFFDIFFHAAIGWLHIFCIIIFIWLGCIQNIIIINYIKIIHKIINTWMLYIIAV